MCEGAMDPCWESCALVEGRVHQTIQGGVAQGNITLCCVDTTWLYREGWPVALTSRRKAFGFKDGTSTDVATWATPLSLKVIKVDRTCRWIRKAVSHAASTLIPNGPECWTLVCVAWMLFDLTRPALKLDQTRKAKRWHHVATQCPVRDEVTAWGNKVVR